MTSTTSQQQEFDSSYNPGAVTEPLRPHLLENYCNLQAFGAFS